MTHSTPSQDPHSRWTAWEQQGLPPSLRPRLQATGQFTAEALTTLEGLVEELDAGLVVAPASMAVDRFLSRGDAWSEHLDRWAALRIFEVMSQLDLDPLSWPGWAPPPGIRRRPLRGIEIGLVRLLARRNRGQAATVGALDSGAASGELGRIRAVDLVRDEAQRVVAVTLRGTQRRCRSGYPEAAPRTVELQPWCRDAFTRLAITARDPEGLLLYAGSQVDEDKIQSTLLMRVGAVLRDAGLAGDPTVKPLSIRNTAGAAARDHGGIEAAAALLGLWDLTRVAREIGALPQA